MKPNLKKLLTFLICFLLILEQSCFAQVAAQLDIAGQLANLHRSLTTDRFRPLHLRYLQYDPAQNNFHLLIDKGTLKNPSNKDLEDTSKDLLKYFFIGLSLPNDAFWVNLRPDSPDSIIDDKLAQTDIGRILLEADLELKKDTAKATSPATPEGKVYWDKLYQKAEELFGSQNLTIPTLTRPWIVPDEIIIRENTDSAYVYKATLKVMLEEDYLNAQETSLRATQNKTKGSEAISKGGIASSFASLFPRNDIFESDPRLKQLNEYSTQLIRESIIPKLTKEINTSKKYATLRQVYYSLILAQWFKARFSTPSLRGGAAGGDEAISKLINSRNLTNLTSQDPYSKDTYFKAYQKSFKDGEYNFREPISAPFGQVVRSYFSGGITGIAPAVMPASVGALPVTDPNTGARITSAPAQARLPQSESNAEVVIQTDGQGDIAQARAEAIMQSPDGGVPQREQTTAADKNENPATTNNNLNLAAGKKKKLSHSWINTYIKVNLPDTLKDNPSNIAQYAYAQGFGVKARVIPIQDLFSFSGRTQFAHIGLGRIYNEPVIYIDADYATSKAVIEHELYEIYKWELKRNELRLEPDQMRRWILDNFEEADQLAEQWHNEAPSLGPLYASVNMKTQEIALEILDIYSPEQDINLGGFGSRMGQYKESWESRDPLYKFWWNLRYKFDLEARSESWGGGGETIWYKPRVWWAIIEEIFVERLFSSNFWNDLTYKESTNYYRSINTYRLSSPRLWWMPFHYLVISPLSFLNSLRQNITYYAKSCFYRWDRYEEIYKPRLLWVPFHYAIRFLLVNLPKYAYFKISDGLKWAYENIIRERAAVFISPHFALDSDSYRVDGAFIKEYRLLLLNAYRKIAWQGRDFRINFLNQVLECKDMIKNTDDFRMVLQIIIGKIEGLETTDAIKEFISLDTGEQNTYIRNRRNELRKIRRGGFDRSNRAHLFLGFHLLQKELETFKFSKDFSFEDWKKLLLQGKNIGLVSVDKNNAEMNYLAYEQVRLINFIRQLKIKADALGRPLVVVPNLSYGAFAISAIKDELKEMGVKIIEQTKAGSTAAHDFPVIMHGRNKDSPDDSDLFRIKDLRYIIEKEPIVVVIDGSYSLDPERIGVRGLRRRQARFPDAHQVYRNYFYAISGNPQDDDFGIGGLYTRRREKLSDCLRAYGLYEEVRRRADRIKPARERRL